MSVDELTNKTAKFLRESPCIQEVAADLFSSEAAIRESAIARLAVMGSPAALVLSALVLRPLNFALERWPEWQDMLPARAILGRCRTGRQAAMQALAQIGRPAVPHLAHLLQSNDAELRQEAADALARINAPEAVEALRQMLYAERAQTRRRWQWWNMKRLVGLRRAAVAAMSRAKNTRYVGALASCLDDPDPHVRRSAAQSLRHILPHMQARDRNHLSPNEMNALLRALDGDDPDLAVAVLTAFQQIGDKRALRRVAFLIDSPVHYESVRNAAWECLPQVKLRLQEAQEAEALLRPAHDVENTHSEDLLRPVRD